MNILSQVENTPLHLAVAGASDAFDPSDVPLPQGQQQRGVGAGSTSRLSIVRKLLEAKAEIDKPNMVRLIDVRHSNTKSLIYPKRIKTVGSIGNRLSFYQELRLLDRSVIDCPISFILVSQS